MPNGNPRRHLGVPPSTHDARRLTAPSAKHWAAAALISLVGASAATPAQAQTPSRQVAITNATQAVWQAPEQSLAAQGDAFTVKDVILDADGGAHVRFLREHDDIPVIGGDLVVHLKPGGGLRSMNVAQTAPITDDPTPARPASAARSFAQSRFGGSADTPTLVYDATKGAPRLAHDVVVHDQDGVVPSRKHVLVDADTGKQLRTWSEAKEAVGTGYTQYSGTRYLSTTAVTGGYSLATNVYGPATICYVSGSTCTEPVDADNVWGDGTVSDPNTLGADASFGLDSTFDFLDSWFGRTGVYSDNTPLKLVVGGPTLVGAFNGGKDPDDPTAPVVVYLPNDTSGRPWTSVDIVAHEVAHSLTEDTANLDYSGGESSGLNESTSDIMGTLTEFYTATTARPANYKLGEDLSSTGTPKRYMYHPSLDGNSQDCWSSSTASIDAHYSSGLGNKFFFMLAEGSSGSSFGTAPTCGAPDVVGIGRWSAARIWYRALTVYMDSSTAYQATGNNDARAATLDAATDLFGTCSKEYQAVQAAWTATGVAGEDATCPLIVSTATATGSSASLTSDTTLGSTVDWIHWQSSSSSMFDRKNATQRISTWSLVGASGNTGTETTSPTTFSWTDATGGTPSGSATTGVSRKLTNGRGLKFSIPINASESRTLRVFVGVRGATTTGTLSASLGTGAPITQTAVGNSTTAIKNSTFTIKVHPSAATTLNVEFTQTAGGSATGSAVVLYGAALH